MAVAACRAEQFTADFPQAALQLPAVEGRILPHGSGGKDEFVAKSRRDGTTGFQQRCEMGLCGLLFTIWGNPAIQAGRKAESSSGTVQRQARLATALIGTRNVNHSVKPALEQRLA